LNETELLASLREGSEQAYDGIFRAHYAQLVGLAESMLRDRAEAEEVAQDVMLELWRRRHHLTVESSLRAYLLRATRNRALNRIRHERVVKGGEGHAQLVTHTNPQGERQLVETEIETALQAAIAELPPRCREVFELSRVHGLRYAEIASAMEISVKTVEVQMGKALKLLRERLSRWLPEGGV
jgi:RNA polymerase sigma-70 factor, ECF subfamily